MATNGTFTLGINAQFTNVSASNQFKGNQNDSSNAPAFTWGGDEKTGIFHQSSNVIGIATGGVNRLTISSNIGVGVSNPVQALDVAGNINFSGLLYKSGVPYVGSQWSNNSSNIFALSSNVGINTSAPSKDVAGDINFTGALFKSGVPYVGSQWSNNSSNIFTLNSNVGINTSTPQHTLDVNGDIGCSNIVASGVTFTFSTLTTNLANINGSNFLVTGDSSNTPGYSWVGDTSTGMYRQGSNIIGFSTGGSNVMCPAYTILHVY